VSAPATGSRHRLHADALATLRSWTAPGPGQEALRTAYVEHLAQHPDGAERGCFPDHLTAGTLVHSPDGREVLLNLHRKARRWFAFGGHIEPGDETVAGAALREAVEESGIPDLVLDRVPVHLDRHQVDFCVPPGSPGRARGKVRHLDVRYCAVAPAGSRHAVSEESLDVRWWPVHDLPTTLEDEMHTLIALSRARLR
jgi:8-oxo-dGTP pyrophosphatase MutT (NUDIX family)